ncbi:MAG TPA: CDP-diacylglycerol--serine O-phosphatidyltransferase [Blastocatellia bacterium]|nr:CDP-diacylglycerol--serine O-phosphatidyltransferase [Blastocatellia bacterium]
MADGGVEKSERAARRLRKGVFVVPSLLTTANIFCGFYSVMESIAGSERLALNDLSGATEHFDRAAINIGIAWLFDSLDGRIARMTGATTEFGLELDSIADVLSFGIAPAVLAYSWGYGQTLELHKFAWAVSFLFVICGALRLARFNVLARQVKPPASASSKPDKKGFVGLPIPAAAGLIAAIAHFRPKPLTELDPIQITGSFRADSGHFATALMVLVVGLSFLMISTIRYSSFKGAGTRNYHPRILILVLTFSGLAIWINSRWSLLVLSVGYVTHGLAGKLWSLLRLRHPDKSETDLAPRAQHD